MKSHEKEIERLKRSNHFLKREYGRLSLLLKFGQQIAAETNLSRLLTHITDGAKETLHADRCSLFLLDRDTDELVIKVAHGLDEIRLPKDKGLAGEVFTTGEPVNITDAYKDPRFNPDVDKATGYQTKTILCLPMRNQESEIIGVFQVLNKRQGIFDHTDEQLLTILASQAAGAVENAQLYHELRKSFDSFVETLARSIESRDSITAGHTMRVTEYAMEIGRQLNIGKAQLELLYYCGVLHDFGKIGIREAVLAKPGKLSDEEYHHIQEHATFTREILENIYFRREFHDIPQIASSHHEKFNGKGYPMKLHGEEIPLLGRILAVADVFDAITFKRHYRDPMPISKALAIITQDAGTHFDPSCVASFMAIPLGQIVRIFESEILELLKAEEIDKLNEITLGQFHKISQKEAPDPEEKVFISLFDFYYTHRDPEDFEGHTVPIL